jgi:site-specific recombinase XerD
LVPENLRFALPCKIAKKVAIITTLNDNEVSLLYSAKDRAESPLELRDAAIAMIILRMGFRAGDITSLKFYDISLKNRTISISQNKTRKPLVLPMPIMVGNCIYRYLTQGRPKSESDFVFLSSKAPYSKLKSSACADAIKRMLYADVKVKQGHGSRIVRKTFASRMLKTGNSADSIANMLGHDGIHTVMKYLSTDDERMCLCAIPAGKLVQA